ncbi:MAG: N-acetylmuramoyl-L-alanine amidase [Polyangiales bacterium]|jgi:N-acetylmuramoyl-L-alanine amidase
MRGTRGGWCLSYAFASLFFLSCEEPLETDPLEALQAADLERFDAFEAQAASRTEDGVASAIESADFAERAGLARETHDRVRVMLERAAEWREQPNSCEALARLTRFEDDADIAAQRYRTFVYGCSDTEPGGVSDAVRARIDREASRCEVVRVRALDSGGGSIRVLLNVAGGMRGRCEHETTESLGGLRMSFASLTRSADVPSQIPVRAESIQALRFEDNEIHFELNARSTTDEVTFEEPLRFVVDIQLPPERDDIDVAPVIVLDPGHGGVETGARYEELTESNLVLDLARRTAVAIRARAPSARVFLTREADIQLPLEDRAARANALGADLFVSIHLNALNETVYRGGITTFVLDTGDDIQAARLAARENGTRVHEVTGLQRILAGIHRRGQLDESRALADAVHQSTLAGARTILPQIPDRGVKSAVFYVLVGARMPAILLEASFLTKPEEAEALRTEVYRERLSDGIAEGILNYLSRPEEPSQ